MIWEISKKVNEIELQIIFVQVHIWHIIKSKTKGHLANSNLETQVKMQKMRTLFWDITENTWAFNLEKCFSFHSEC